jgi:hypothetical protein
MSSADPSARRHGKDHEAVTSAPGPASRQARRARWIVQDLVACSRALAHVVSHVRRIDQPIGIGFLEGEPRALEGRPNAYRIRLVNDTPAAAPLTLQLRGETDARRFATRVDCVLAGRATREVLLVTDWVERFEIAEAAPIVDGIAFSLAPDGVRRCLLVATLMRADHRVEELASVQPLIGCVSST